MLLAYSISLGALLLGLAATTHAATLYVANNGLDGPACGPKATPCRSISLAVNERAADGDKVVVGPGRYGDLDNSGVLADGPGEENGAFGCIALLARPVTLESSDGAAATIIEGGTVDASCNVGIFGNGTRFGKPGKGFMVTNTLDANATGIFVNATDVTIAGNQVIALGDLPGGSRGTGFVTKSNLFGNVSCGLLNQNAATVSAVGNFWGAVSGPDAVNPADDVCADTGGGPTTVFPFAGKPFKVKAPIKP